MERKITFFLAFLVGMAFMYIPMRYYMFESLTPIIAAFIYVIGFVVSLWFGLMIIFEAFKSLKAKHHN
ncbi:MAG: hypothetical protein H0Z32_15020 [Bacillaceae bacterium]|nr:hypothetical protein [Bacillaceae bacterium]